MYKGISMKKIYTLLVLIAMLAPLAPARADFFGFDTTTTSAALQAKYKAAATGGPKVKVLVMPGHEPTYGGAVYGTLYERDINVDIANKLAADLAKDPRLEVVVARTKTAWLPALQDYFTNSWQSILDFITSHKATTAALQGGVGDSSNGFQTGHNSAADDPARRLYGISKWGNENGVDIAIHIHINDSGDHGAASPGNQQGFAIYVPDAKYGNAGASRSLGNAIMDELKNTNMPSTLPIENLGVVGDQELIALGAYNTANFASVLVEYGYIYESKLVNAGARDTVEGDWAWQTYRGVEDFFQNPKGNTSSVLPYAWKVPSPAKSTSAPEVYALQTALHKLGFYPPAGLSLYDCPISGFNGTCTQTALNAFQKSKGWTPTGSIGPMTAAALKKAGF
jgi:N-acetylmuramoyl-L-alanine amidase